MAVLVPDDLHARSATKSFLTASWRLLLVVFYAALLTSSLSFLKSTDSAWAAEKWGKRYALVVGNSDYRSAESLANPARDASDVAAALERLKFNVTLVTNTTNRQLLQTLSQFRARLTDADTVLFYYAGHGFQLNGANFLVPVDARLENRRTLESQTIALNDIINTLNDRKHQTIVLLDACRNNPLPKSARNAEDPQGLAQVQTGNGTFIAFATQPGNITRDGRGRNSPFTRALLTFINEPKTSISDLMINVRNEVDTETLGTQTPWDASSLRTQFYFNPNDQWTGQIAALQPGDNGQTRLYDTGRSVGLSEDAGRTPGLIISGSGPSVPVTPANPETTHSGPRPPQSPGLSLGSGQPPAKKPAADKKTIIAALPPRAKPFLTPGAVDDKALAAKVQRDLQRLGCMAAGPADGVWDERSEIALGSYFRARRQPIKSLSPSDELARQLEAQPGKVCSTPAVIPKRIVKRPPPARIRKPARRLKTSPPRNKVVKARSQRPAARRPAGKTKIKLKGIFR